MAGATDFAAIHLRDPEPGWPRLPVGDRSWSREVRPEHCLPGANVEGRNHAMRSLHSIATIGSANYRAQRGRSESEGQEDGRKLLCPSYDMNGTHISPPGHRALAYLWRYT